jgi:hypothetical protein
LGGRIKNEKVHMGWAEENQEPLDHALEEEWLINSLRE